MGGGQLTIAILGLLAGSSGAWLTWVQLRDEQRRFANRARLGWGTYGDVIAVPDEAKRTGRRENSCAGRGWATERAGQSFTHNNSGSKRAARKPQ